jgi:hypothetical protein
MITKNSENLSQVAQKLCPFCCSNNIMKQSVNNFQAGYMHWMHCNNCGASGPIVDALYVPTVLWDERPIENRLENEVKVRDGMLEQMASECGNEIKYLRESLHKIFSMVYEASLDERNNLAVEIRNIARDALE